MPLVPITKFYTVENNEMFSETLQIIHEIDESSPPNSALDEVLTLDSPPTVSIRRSDDLSIEIENVGATAVLNGEDIDITFQGTHNLSPFDSEIHHFTRGKSNLWEAPIVSKSFAAVLNKGKQVYKWVPDYSPKTIEVVLTYYSSWALAVNGNDPTQPITQVFTQVVSPNYDVAISDFLASI